MLRQQDNDEDEGDEIGLFSAKINVSDVLPSVSLLLKMFFTWTTTEVMTKPFFRLLVCLCAV